ncbi:MAG: ferredoxin [Candidatus Berkelbacteria bacterium]|nr:ferredoxin [Candidatus Berkelbacteria bacterium]
MKIKVDREMCIGCMTCVNLCETCFEMIDGKSSPKKDCQLSDCNLQEVVGSCPVGAIEIKEDSN